MGIANLFTSTTGLVAAFTNFGLGTSAVKDVAEAHASGDNIRVSQTVSVFRKLVWITGFFGAILTLILSPWLSELTFGSHNYTWSFILLSTTLLINQLTAGQNVILQGTRKIKYLASANIIGALASLLITIPLYYYYGVEGIVPALILTAMGTFSVAVFFSRKVKIKVHSPSLKEIYHRGKGMLKMGFFISLSGAIAMLTSYLIRIYISNTGGVEDVGLYSAGFQIIGTYVGLVFTAMGTDYYPRLSGVANDANKRNVLVNQQGEIAMLILFPIILVFIVFIPFIIQILYSAQFLPIQEMIIWAGLGMFFKAGSWAIAFQFMAKGSSKLFFFNELATNLYLLFFNVLGYTYYGVTGLGYSFLLTYIIYFVQVYVITNWQYNFNFNKGFLIAISLAVITSILCIFVVLKTQDVFKYLIGCILIASAIIYSIRQINLKTDFLNKSDKE